MSGPLCARVHGTVCVSVCLSVCMLQCVRVCAHMCDCGYVCGCVHTCVHASVCDCVCLRVCAHTNVAMCATVCAHTRVHSSMCECVCMCECVHTRMHALVSGPRQENTVAVGAHDKGSEMPLLLTSQLRSSSDGDCAVGPPACGECAWPGDLKGQCGRMLRHAPGAPGYCGGS